jgi:hypothetical protein
VSAGCAVGPSRNKDMVTGYLQRQARKVPRAIQAITVATTSAANSPSKREPIWQCHCRQTAPLAPIFVRLHIRRARTPTRTGVNANEMPIRSNNEENQVPASCDPLTQRGARGPFLRGRSRQRNPGRSLPATPCIMLISTLSMLGFTVCGASVPRPSPGRSRYSSCKDAAFLQSRTKLAVTVAKPMVHDGPDKPSPN